MPVKPFAVLDVETTGLSARPESFVFGCLYSHNFKKVFHTVNDFKKFLFSPLNPYKNIFAHNAEFDYTCLFDNIIQNLDNSALFVGSMFVKAKCEKITFYNSLPILKASVEQLGKHSGLQKGILDDKFKNAKTGDKIKVTKEDIEYCFRDCEIIYDYLVKMFSLTDRIKPTIASSAMHIFTKKYLQRTFINNPHNEVFRYSYYGGRVECFRFGKINPIYKYDVNSLYPYVCTKMNFPDFNKIKKAKSMDIKKFLFILENMEGNAEVVIEHKENFVGCLPYRTQTEIMFPWGTFSGYWNFNELRVALKSGYVKIKKVKNVYYAPKMYFSELADYMKDFYHLKNTTEGAEKMINKFLLNALTGKFGQKEHGQRTYFKNLQEYHDSDIRFSKNIKTFHHFSPDREDFFIEVFKTGKNKTPSKWNIPTVSSYICSEARAYMLEFYLKYQKFLCYTDTDSLVLTVPLDPKFVDSEKLGFFKRENDERINIKGNKRYDTYIKKEKFSYIKGISKKYKKDYKGRYVFKKMVRTKESINRGLKAGVFIDVKKQLTNDYTKRKVLKNGKTKILKLKDNG